MLETIHKWPAKCENHKCFLLHEFLVIQYLGKQSLKAQAKITQHDSMLRVYNIHMKGLTVTLHTYTCTYCTLIITGKLGQMYKLETVKACVEEIVIKDFLTHATCK